MKKLSFVSLLFLCLTLFSTNSFANITLKVGTDDWPPYEYRTNGSNDGAISGFSTEILLATLKKMNVKVSQLNEYPWARGEFLLQKGEIDALYSSTRSKKREKQFYFPDTPLIESKWVMFIKKSDVNRLRFNTLNDLKGKTVGVVRDYSYTSEFWSFIKKEGNFEEASGDETNFKKLINDRLEYVVCEYAVGMSMLKRLGWEDKVVALTNNPIKSAGLYVMFSKATVKKNFVDSFSDQLKRFKASQDYKLIYKKYFQ